MSKNQSLGLLSGPKSLPSESSGPDALLPAQYFDGLVARASDLPEKRLMLAVLLDAAMALQRRNSSAAVEAERWIRGEHLELPPFTFEKICENLGLDPAYLGRGLLAWHTAPDRTSIRRLRTSQRRVTPLGRRRRRLGLAGRAERL